MPALIRVAVVSSLLAGLIAFVPSLTFLVAICWGAVLLSGGIYLQRSQLVLIFMLNVIVLYVIAGASTLFFYLAFFVIPALVMSLMGTYNKSYYDLRRWGIITAVLGVSLFLGLAFMETGDIGIAQLQSQMDSYIEDTIEAYEEAGFLSFYEERGISKAELESSFKELGSNIAQHLPAMYYLQAIVVVFFIMLLASYTDRKNHNERLKKRPFTQEIMSWQLAWLVIAGLGLWLWGRDQSQAVYYAGSNLLAVLVPITVYYGLSVLIFKLKGSVLAGRKWIIAALIILTILFPISAIIFLSLIGLFDSLLNIRKLQLE